MMGTVVHSAIILTFFNEHHNSSLNRLLATEERLFGSCSKLLLHPTTFLEKNLQSPLYFNGKKYSHYFVEMDVAGI